MSALYIPVSVCTLRGGGGREVRRGQEREEESHVSERPSSWGTENQACRHTDCARVMCQSLCLEVSPLHIKLHLEGGAGSKGVGQKKLAYASFLLQMGYIVRADPVFGGLT